MKIVINTQYGGFCVKDCMKKHFPELRWEFEGQISWNRSHESLRTSQIIIDAIESGQDVGDNCKLKVVEIPDGIEYTIEEYDGVEWIAEKHRTWW